MPEVSGLLILGAATSVAAAVSSPPGTHTFRGDGSRRSRWARAVVRGPLGVGRRSRRRGLSQVRPSVSGEGGARRRTWEVQRHPSRRWPPPTTRSEPAATGRGPESSPGSGALLGSVPIVRPRGASWQISTRRSRPRPVTFASMVLAGPRSAGRWGSAGRVHGRPSRTATAAAGIGKDRSGSHRFSEVRMFSARFAHLRSGASRRWC